MGNDLAVITIRTLIMVFLLRLSSSSHAQENDQWMLEDLLSNPAPIGQIVCFQHHYTEPLFWPDDLETPDRKPGRVDYLIKNNAGLFLIPDGTGRVYTVFKQGEGIEYARIDSTKYTGYNFSDFKFSFHDTLFSLGGYGFWRINGHLRYYKPSSYGWEILPLNNEVPIRYEPFNQVAIWLDNKSARIFYIDCHYVKEWLKAQNSRMDSHSDTTRIWQLDLSSKDWKITGTLTKESAAILNNSNRLISLPWGELFLTPPRQSFALHLLDYSANKIYLLNKHKAAPIIDLIYTDQTSDAANKRIMLYASDSTINLVTSNKEKLSVHLSLKDFSLTDISFYSSAEQQTAFGEINRFPLIALLTGFGLSLIAIFGVVAKVKKSRTTQSLNQTHFDKAELELVNAIFNKPGYVMAMDEINFLLGTSKKSVDVQKKHRSDIIKSINEKYKDLSGDTEKLLTQERLENDKRQVRYRMNSEKFERLQRDFQLDKTHGNLKGKL